VTDIVTEPRDQAIVRLAIELGHSLGMVMLAEGVEDQATLDLLTSYGCDLVQGYLLSRPMPALDLPTWIRTRRALRASREVGPLEIAA
jgi:EAL domain-containing protein (putative c-di-GMP-specific phosphodiesterase class I)